MKLGAKTDKIATTKPVSFLFVCGYLAKWGENPCPGTQVNSKWFSKRSLQEIGI
jgi:hypothetical protein